MRMYHNTRELACRKPFGALEVGAPLQLLLFIDPEDRSYVSRCSLRTWTYEKGEKIYDMEPVSEGFRFYGSFSESAVLWYHFIVYFHDGGCLRYGPAEGRVGGKGRIYDYEPPSFQITVYEKRELPKWYREAVVYQIFPDVFARDWGGNLGRGQGLCDSDGQGLRQRRGPARRMAESWEQLPLYEKNPDGSIKTWIFHGGNLRGIEGKLPYLKELGISAIYLNPIFEAASWHRYDTADYMKIDPLLGTEEDFKRLCKRGEELGIRIILDGVFNHTGCDSVYFDRYGNYGRGSTDSWKPGAPACGAYGHPDSPYRDWYSFKETDKDGSGEQDEPETYECWWGVTDLPDVNEMNSSYREFINGKEGVVRHWLRCGASGYRLDVADELPDEFIEELKTAVVSEKQDGLVLGEVWEDASNKVSYGKLRRYFLGRELDGVMNYVFRSAVMDFLRGKQTGEEICETFESLRENYPRTALYGSLNLIGSHDRARVLTLLGDAPEPESLSDEQRRNYRLPEDKLSLAKSRLWLALVLQMTSPGVPSIYYGDEAGLEGYADPYNRAPYPWGNEDGDTLVMHQEALALRRSYLAFVDGEFEPFAQGQDVYGFWRYMKGPEGEEACTTGGEEAESRRAVAFREKFAVVVNRSLWEPRQVVLDVSDTGPEAFELLNGKEVEITEGKARFTLGPLDVVVIRFGKPGTRAAELSPGAGVLCHITSVPEGLGGGVFADARRFADSLSQAGITYWQMLPINPTDKFGSPYAGTSAFAGNVDLLGLSQQQLSELYADFDIENDSGYREFERKQSYWLHCYLDTFEGKDEQDFQGFCQYLFQKHWMDLKDYVNARGISLIGDIPMFVSGDSADVKAWPEYFCLDGEGRTLAQAGVPPDSFSEEGQLWGNPLYNWEAMEKDGFTWWIQRLSRLFELFDYVRLDHFRGFEASWSVAAGKTPKEGRWIRTGGDRLFEAAYEKFGPLPVIAEDLGIITPGVRALMDVNGFTGMDIMQFSNCDPMEYRAPKGKIVYTGTHDNDTLVGFCEKRYAEEVEQAKEKARKLAEICFESGAPVVIIPLQDAMLLGSEARMNLPGTTENNWKWKARKEDMAPAMKWLGELVKSMKG